MAKFAALIIWTESLPFVSFFVLLHGHGPILSFDRACKFCYKDIFRIVFEITALKSLLQEEK